MRSIAISHRSAICRRGRRRGAGDHSVIQRSTSDPSYGGHRNGRRSSGGRQAGGTEELEERGEKVVVVVEKSVGLPSF